MRILVTGAHGFLGRNVALQVATQGSEVTGIGHGAWGDADLARSGLSFWHSSDVSLDAMVTYAGEPDVIVHCAGSGSVGFSVAHPYQDYLRTVGSTAAVLEYIRVHSPGTVLVYPSSAAVYGEANRLPIHEDATPNPLSPYGVHKLMAEQLCRSHASVHGLSIAIVRFFSIYGEGLRKQLLWDACSKAMSGQHAFSGSGLEVRDWLHVQDAASLVMIAANEASAKCPTFNGGSGIGSTVREILDSVFAQFPAARAPAFTGVRRPGDPLGYQANIDAATRLAWKPTVPWRDGVRRYVDWFKAQTQ